MSDLRSPLVVEALAKYGLFPADDPVTASLERYFEIDFEWGNYPNTNNYIRSTAKRLIDEEYIEDPDISIEEFYLARGAAIAIAWIKSQGLGKKAQNEVKIIDWLVNAKKNEPIECRMSDDFP